MFPTQIIGISALLLFLKDCRNLAVENKNKYIRENGKKIIDQKDILLSSQNLGFLNLIIQK